MQQLRQAGMGHQPMCWEWEGGEPQGGVWAGTKWGDSTSTWEGLSGVQMKGRVSE